MKIDTKKILNLFYKDLNYAQVKDMFETEEPISINQAYDILDDYKSQGLKQPSLESIINASQRFYFRVLDTTEDYMKYSKKKPYVIIGDQFVEHFNKYTNSYSKSLELIFNSFKSDRKDEFYPLLPLEMTRRFQKYCSDKETENGGYDKLLHYLFSEYLTHRFWFLTPLIPVEKIFSLGEEPIKHIFCDISADLRGIMKCISLELFNKKKFGN